MRNELGYQISASEAGTLGFWPFSNTEDKIEDAASKGFKYNWDRVKAKLKSLLNLSKDMDVLQYNAADLQGRAQRLGMKDAARDLKSIVKWTLANENDALEVSSKVQKHLPDWQEEAEADVDSGFSGLGIVMSTALVIGLTISVATVAIVGLPIVKEMWEKRAIYKLREKEIISAEEAFELVGKATRRPITAGGIISKGAATGVAAMLPLLGIGAGILIVFSLLGGYVGRKTKKARAVYGTAKDFYDTSRDFYASTKKKR